MDNSFESMVNGMLEKFSRGYDCAMEEWKADRRNPFKDGRFLACFEVLKMIPAAV